MDALSAPHLRQGVELAAFTTWKVGGPAEYFSEPESIEELEALLDWGRQKGLPLQLIGAGSNLLISDGGLSGLVVCSRHLQGAQLAVFVVDAAVVQNCFALRFNRLSRCFNIFLLCSTNQQLCR